MTDPAGAGIYANMTGVYWWDPWHTIYSSTVRIRHGYGNFWNTPRWDDRWPTGDWWSRSAASGDVAWSLRSAELPWPRSTPSQRGFSVRCHFQNWKNICGKSNGTNVKRLFKVVKIEVNVDFPLNRADHWIWAVQGPIDLQERDFVRRLDEQKRKLNVASLGREEHGIICAWHSISMWCLAGTAQKTSEPGSYGWKTKKSWCHAREGTLTEQCEMWQSMQRNSDLLWEFLALMFGTLSFLCAAETPHTSAYYFFLWCLSQWCTTIWLVQSASLCFHVLYFSDDNIRTSYLKLISYLWYYDFQRERPDTLLRSHHGDPA